MRFRSVILLILVSLAAGPARAQDLAGFPAERFQPLHVGNLWIYGVLERTGLQYADGYLVNRIEGDTLIDGSRHLVLRVTELDASGGEIRSSRCTYPPSYSRSSSYLVVDRQTSPLCALQLVASDLAPNQFRVEAPGQVRMGTTEYAVAANLYTGFSVSIPGAGGGGQSWYRAADLGTYYYHEAISCTGCSARAWTARLLYARVSGVYWGQSPGLAVHVDPQEEVPQASLLQVYPNPATSGFHVEDGSGLSMEITVYDTLGRVVRRVSGPGPQFISRDELAPGVYLVRGDRGGSRLVVFQ